MAEKDEGKSPSDSDQSDADLEEKIKQQLADDEEGNEGDEDDSDEDVEARARRMGWTDKDEYRGPDGKWLPAEEFIDKVENEIPVLRERNRFLNSQLEKQELSMTDMQAKMDEMSKVLVEMNDYNKRIAEQSYARARAELEAEMEAAVEESDTERYRKAKQGLEEIDKQKPAADSEEGKGNQADKTAQLTAAEQKFVDDNQAFVQDPIVWEEFTKYYGAYRGQGMTDVNALAKAKEMTLKRNPYIQQDEPVSGGNSGRNPKKDEPSSVSRPTAPGGSKGSGKKTVKDLPREAQEELERFKRHIPDFTDEQYLKDYDWGKAE